MVKSVKIQNVADCRKLLIQVANGVMTKQVTPSEAKTISYVVQTILTTLKMSREEAGFGEDSIKDLVTLIQEARLNAKAKQDGQDIEKAQAKA